MFLANFDFESTQLDFHKAPNGEPVVSASSLIKALKGNATNAAAITRSNVRAKWLIELPTPKGGRPMLCLFEPGCYQLAGNPMFQTELAERFQDWLFEKVLPKLRASGGYIMPKATSEQLEALQSEIADLERINKALTRETNTKFIIQQFILQNLEFKKGSLPKGFNQPGSNYILAEKAYERLETWLEYQGYDLRISSDSFIKLLDVCFKEIPATKSDRFYISNKNGFGDIENAVLMPVSRFKRGGYKETTIKAVGE
jgi:prophage antirepressor-like protein